LFSRLQQHGKGAPALQPEARQQEQVVALVKDIGPEPVRRARQPAIGRNVVDQFQHFEGGRRQDRPQAVGKPLQPAVALPCPARLGADHADLVSPRAQFRNQALDVNGHAVQRGSPVMVEDAQESPQPGCPSNALIARTPQGRARRIGRLG
jgi:hypothetical protein